MDWCTSIDYGGHPGAPPRRDALQAVTVNRETLMRIRSIQTDSSGGTSDSGWSDWGVYGVGVDWLLPGYSVTAGSSWVKIELLIEVAAGIGRPWKIIWIDKITNNLTGAVSYSSESSQVFHPGDSASVLYDAANNTTQQIWTAAALLPADGV